MTETLYINGRNGKSFIRAILYMALAEVALTLQDILIQFFISKHLGVDGLTAFGLVYPMFVLMMSICSLWSWACIPYAPGTWARTIPTWREPI